MIRFVIAVCLLALLACSPKPKPEPVAQVVEAQEVKAPIRSMGLSLPESEPGTHFGPSTMFALDDDKVHRDIDTDFLLLAKRITLTGHACPLGEPGYNLTLSLRRAKAVKANLVKSGVKPEIITLFAKGESDPLPGDYSLSRRVTIAFTLR